MASNSNINFNVQGILDNTNQSVQNLHTELIIKPLYYLGLWPAMTKRFMVFAILAALIIWFFKPRRFFDENGKPFPQKIWNRRNESAIYFDWIAGSLSFGVLWILFV